MTGTMIPSRGTNAEVLVALAALLGASVATFWALVRRWESHRQWHALAEWAAERKLRFRSVERQGVPPILNSLFEHSPAVRLYLGDAATLLLQFQTPPKHLAGELTFSSKPVVWNVLVRRIEASWHPTGLRPTSAKSSVLDLFSLSGFPLLGTTERFTLFGTDSAAARTLSGSMTRSLLPPDVGLLLRENELVLDFSDRPFDQIELDRMRALADQLVEKLPHH